MKPNKLISLVEINPTKIKIPNTTLFQKYWTMKIYVVVIAHLLK
jgi:hypothetical protein